jgi:hypothetical protein
LRRKPNKLSDLSSWDDAGLALHLKELSELALDFDFEAIGFDLPEVDFRIQSLDSIDTADRADEFKTAAGPAVSIPGDLWLLGEHRVYCGSALQDSSYEVLLGSEKARAVFTDPPYNVKIDGNVCGSGSIKHREFVMASGEMSPNEFALFLTQTLGLVWANASPGAMIYACMDWRHMSELLAAARETSCETLNVCVWVKSNGGMGSLSDRGTNWFSSFAMARSPTSTMCNSAGSAETERMSGTIQAPTAFHAKAERATSAFIQQSSRSPW